MANRVDADCGAFELLFLDVPESLTEVSRAGDVLHATSIARFTEVAATTLEDRQIKPSRKSFTTRRFTWFHREGNQKFLAWHFHTYLPGPSANSRIERWLCADRSWALYTGSQVAVLTERSSFLPAELTREHKAALIDGRGSRVATWLDNPKGSLNPGVT